MHRLRARALVAAGVALVAVIVLAVAVARSLRAAPTDPAGAKTCSELVDRSARLVAKTVASLRDKTEDDLRAANPDDPFGLLTHPFEAFSLRAKELNCDEGELRRLACRAYEGIEPTGPLAEEYLATFVQTCREG